MLCILVYQAPFRRHALDVFDLDLLDGCNDVVCEQLDHGHGTTLTQRAIWTVEGEVIRHFGCSDAKIANWLISVYVLQVDAFGDDWEPWDPGSVETGSTDDDIDFFFAAIWSDYTSSGDLLETRVPVDSDVRLY